MAEMLPKGCGYMGHDFGAPYLDSECFGGQLYDLDDGENGLINEPEEYIPCPACNVVEAVKRLTMHYYHSGEDRPWHLAVARINVVRRSHGLQEYVPGHNR